jgi:hypothetical protein
MNLPGGRSEWSAYAPETIELNMTGLSGLLRKYSLKNCRRGESVSTRKEAKTTHLVELGTHLLELSLGRAELESSIDAVRGEDGAVRVRVPFREDL